VITGLLLLGPVQLSTHRAALGAGEWVCADDDRVNLRAGPSLDEATVGQLHGAEPVLIVSMATPLVDVGGVTDRWYEVSRGGQYGYTFGAGLSAACGTTDIDGDGELEWVVADMDGGGVHVRVHERAAGVTARWDDALPGSATSAEVHLDGSMLTLRAAGGSWLQVVHYSSAGPGWPGTLIEADTRSVR
jgi:hypothetical protein